MALTKVNNRMIDGSYLNVKDFGATGDPDSTTVAAETSAIQDAIDFASNNKIQTIFFPDGHYKFTTLRFYHDADDVNEEFRDPANGIRDGRFQLVGTGRMAIGDLKNYDGTSTARLYGSVLESVSGGDGLIVDPNAELGAKPDARNFVMRNLTVIADNMKSAVQAESCPGLTIDHCSIKQLNRFGNGVIARNCWFFNMHQTYVFGESEKSERTVSSSNSKTVFTYTFDSPATQEELIVAKNGKLLELTTDYTVNLTTKTVTLTSDAAVGETVRIKRTKKIEETTTVTNASTRAYSYTFDNPDDSTGIAVYKNGILLEEGASKDYTVVMSSTKTVTLTSDPAVNDILKIKRNDIGVGLSGQFVEGTAGEFGNFAGLYTISHSAVDNFEDGIRWTGGKCLNYAVRDTGIQNNETYGICGQRGTLQPIVLDNVYFENPQFPGVSYVKSEGSVMAQLSMDSCFMLGGTTVDNEALPTNLSGVCIDLYQVSAMNINNTHVFRPTTGFLYVETAPAAHKTIGTVSNTVFTTDATSFDDDIDSVIYLIAIGSGDHAVFPLLENNILNASPDLHNVSPRYQLYDQSNNIPELHDFKSGIRSIPRLSIGKKLSAAISTTNHFCDADDETYKEVTCTGSGRKVLIRNSARQPEGHLRIIKNSSDSTNSFSVANNTATGLSLATLNAGDVGFFINTKNVERFAGKGESDRVYTYTFDSPANGGLILVYVNNTKISDSNYTVNLTNKTVTFDAGQGPAVGSFVNIGQYSYQLMGLFSDSAGGGTITAVTAGTGLTGGGTSGSVTLNVNTGAVSDGAATIPTGDHVYDFVIAQGYTTNTGDITNVTAGDGLSGGGASGSVSLAVDSTVARTTGDTFTGNITIDNSAPALRLDDSTTNSYSEIKYDGNDFLIDVDANTSGNGSEIVVKIDTTEQMRMDSLQRIAIGGVAYNGNGGLTINSPDSTTFASGLTSRLSFNRASATSTRSEVLRFRDNGTDRGVIDYNTTSTRYITSSDERLKENIVDAPSASSDIDAIQVRSFDWIESQQHQKYGMIAQELINIEPEAVSGDPNSEEVMGVDYSKLVPMLIKEIQEMRARLAELEASS